MDISPNRNNLLTSSLIFFLLAALAALSWPAAGHEETRPKRWSVAPLLGVNSPQLRLLNDGEFESPLPGQGRLTLPGTGENVDFNFIIENDLEPIDWGTNAGIEFQLLLNASDALVFGLSVWEGGGRSTVFTEIPFQGRLTSTLYERSGSISYFEYYLGWRRNFLVKPRKFNIYGKFLLRELFDIDYREEFVFAFQGVPDESFKRVIVIESQATGVLMLETALGVEYFIHDWISMGMDVGYSYGLSSFRLGNASRRLDIQANDNIRFKLPAIVGPDGTLKYLAEAAPFSEDPSYEEDFYRPLDLKFDGWRLLFRVNFYF